MTNWGEVNMGGPSGLSIGVMQRSERKSPSVIAHRGSVVYTVAYCRSDDEADRFREALIELAGAQSEAAR